MASHEEKGVPKVIDINKCIYCGGVGETNEHVIPFALGGGLLLRNASCEACRDITSRCERNPLNENWAEARAVLDYPSRKRDFNKEIFLLKVTLKDGSVTVLELNRGDAMGLAAFWEYPLPAFFNPSGYKSGAIVTGHSVIGFGTNYQALVEKYGVKTFHYAVTHKGDQIEKMIAKIAYCFTVALWGLDCFEERFVLPTILCKKDDVGYWMGCDPKGEIMHLIEKQNASNVVKLGIWQRANDANRYITAKLKFFAASDAPEYIVIVGTIKPNFIPPAHQVFRP